VRTSTRIDSWSRRLSSATEGAMPALSLYAGEHWDMGVEEEVRGNWRDEEEDTCDQGVRRP
jgi:hypothetical protein